MTQEKYDAILEKAEELADVTGEYFPTVEELIAHHADTEVEKNLFVLAYYASDPFKRLNLQTKDHPEYRETVKFCKRILYQYDPAA